MAFHAVVEFYPGNTDDLHPDEVTWFTNEQEAVDWAKDAANDSGNRALVLNLKYEFKEHEAHDYTRGVVAGLGYPAPLVS